MRPSTRVVFTFFLAACSTGPSGPDAASDSGGQDAEVDGSREDGGGDGGAELRWYATCGDPVCSTFADDPNVPNCDAESQGAACTTENASCERGDDCNTRLLCTSTDPRLGPCPISSRRYKESIVPLTANDLERYRRSLMAIDLHEYRYRDDRHGRTHLGFILEEVAESAAVDRAREQVDLYGYASMAVAALQAQERELEAMRQRVAELERRLDALDPKAENAKRRRQPR